MGEEFYASFEALTQHHKRAHLDITTTDITTERETSRLAAASVARRASDIRAAGVCLSVLRAEDVPRSVFRQLQRFWR